MALTMKDAIRLAAKDPEFANELLTNPAGLAAQFGITNAQVTAIKNIKATDITTMAKKPQAASGGYYQ